MSQFGADIVSALDSFNEDFSKLEGSTGSATRPPNGEWDCFIDRIELSADETMTLYKQGGSKDDKVEIPALTVCFYYKLLGGTSALPPEMKQQQEFPGRTFIIPRGGMKALPSFVTSGKKQQIEISAQRLKGHLQTVLGSSYSNILTVDLKAAYDLVNAKEKGLVAVKVQCKVTPDEKDSNKHYFEEYLKTRLS